MAKTIMLVDDEKDLVDELGTILEGQGYDVVKALSGDEALDCIVEKYPNLVLLDIMMPQINGFEVLSMIKRNAQTEAIPVVMLTAKGETNAIMEAQHLKAADFITKPFDLDELLQVIRRNLR